MTIKFPHLLTLVLLSLTCVMGIVFLCYSSGVLLKSEPPKKQPSVTIQLQSDALGAKAAIVYDPATGKILYDKNGQLTLPLASIAKLITARAVLNKIATSTLVRLSNKDTLGGSDAGDWNLKVGDILRLDDLIKIGLAASSNYAMAAAAGSLGASSVADINADANKLGLSHTYFLNATGLDVTAETSGAYGSAYDVARLAAAFLKKYPQYFELSAAPSVSVEASGRQITANATTRPIQDIPGLIGAKTGYTDLAGGNVVVAYDVDINHPLIAVVLGSTETGRFTDIHTLVEASRRLYSAQNL